MVLSEEKELKSPKRKSTAILLCLIFFWSIWTAQILCR